MRFGYLGPVGTFSHAALLASPRLAEDAEEVPCSSEREAIVAVQEGRIDAALVPVENAIEGGVNATVDALIHDAPDVVIEGEELLDVSHALIGRPGVELDDVTEVISHPQPLGQCRGSLARMFPGRPLRAVSSTAEAVRIVAESSAPLVAVGHPEAAPLYGVSVIREAIEDAPGNKTRFWWVGRAGTSTTATAASAWKSSIVFGGDGDNEPGWLLNSLAAFADRGINLTRIESRPSREHLGHYVFLIDVAGRAEAEPLTGALGALRGRGTSVRVLGSYPVA
ncbi:MAG: prephenate dehydratase [Baekduia sp.]